MSRVAADPAPVPAAASLGESRLVYFRLHGSPRTYWSKYGEQYLDTLATIVHGLLKADEVWCIFDNTASGAAIENACELRDLLTGDPGPDV